MRRIAVLCGILVACSASISARAAQVLRLDNGAEPEFLDPSLMSDSSSTPIGIDVFEGLVSPHPKTLEPIPGVAERWTISEDGKTYTFVLRKNARWTDGKPVTAHDFVYAWRRVVDPATAARQAARLYYVKNGLVINEGKVKDLTQLGVKAVDDYTLVVTLEAPFPAFAQLCTWPTYYPVREDVIKQHGALWTRPEHIVSNGPFVLAEWVPQKHILIKKNPTYWDAATVKLDAAYYYPIEDRATAVKMFQAGQIDWVTKVPATAIEQLKDRPEYGKAEMFALYYFEMNAKRPPLNDPRVRQALSLAIDRETLANKFLRGAARPATNWYVPPGVANYPYFPGARFDPAEAKRLLAEAGFADPAKFPILPVIYNTSEDHRLVAEVIQQMWKTNLGITVTIQNVEWKVLLKLLKQHDFTISRFGGIGEYVYPTTFLETFLTGSSGNYAQWSNARYDGLWKEANMVADPVKRLQIYAEMDKILFEETAMLPLYYYHLPQLLQPWVKGFYRTTMDNHPLKWVAIDARNGWQTIRGRFSISNPSK